MSSRIVYNEVWIRGYLNCLREERALINEIVCSLNAVMYSVDTSSLPQLVSIQHELEQMKGEISKIIDALEEYQKGANSASQILQKAILQTEIPHFLG